MSELKLRPPKAKRSIGVGQGEKAGVGVVFVGDGFETKIGELRGDFLGAFGGLCFDDDIARAPGGDSDAMRAAEVASLVEPRGFLFVTAENSHERSLRPKMFVYGTVSPDGYHWTEGQVEEEMTENPKQRRYRSIVGDGQDVGFIEIRERPKEEEGLRR
jgi:hypothetical protein